jgi:hypothetical protein
LPAEQALSSFKAIIVNGLFEKGCCSLFITTIRQHEIKRITVAENPGNGA